MRIFYFLFLIIILASCDHPKKPYIEELTWPKRTVKLDNDLGTLTIRLPEEFDTFYKFRYNQFHSCSDVKIYRFQNSLFPIIYDTISPQSMDSLKYFEIYHTVYKCSENEKKELNWVESVGKDYFREISLLDTSKTILDTIQSLKIANRQFHTLSWYGGFVFNLNRQKNYKSQHLYSFTRINKDYLLNFNFTCAASNCDSFIPKMYKALKTVQIKPN